MKKSIYKMMIFLICIKTSIVNMKQVTEIQTVIKNNSKSNY